jgi:single-strand DNA-binding protein
MNSITFAGVIGNDAETKFLPDGTAICNFSVADSQGQDKPTIWHRCGLFGKRAEGKLPSYLTKGTHVTVSGQLTQREYTDRDGVKKMAQEIRVQDVALQGGQRQEAAERPAKEPSQREKNLARQHATSRGDDFQDTDLSEVPF